MVGALEFFIQAAQQVNDDNIVAAAPMAFVEIKNTASNRIEREC